MTATHSTASNPCSCCRPTRQPKSKRVLQGEFLSTKVTEGNMGGETVILSLNTPDHCLSHVLLHHQIPQWSHVTPSLEFDHIPDFPKHGHSSPPTSSHLVWSPPNSSNAPNLAHANPDAFRCLHGLQDRTAKRLLQLIWNNIWAGSPGNADLAPAQYINADRTDSDCIFPKLLP